MTRPDTSKWSDSRRLLTKNRAFLDIPENNPPRSLQITTE
jgi:hypothetical protein